MHSVASRIRKLFDNANVEVIFLMNTSVQDSNFTYLTGFTGGVFEQTMLIVTRKGLVLPVSELEYEIAKRERPKEMKVIMVNKRSQARSLMRRYMRSKIVGINGGFIPIEYYRALKKHAKPKRIVDVSKAFYNARSIKESDEIANIRIANRIAKKSIGSVRKKIREGMTEEQVAARIEYAMMENGASGPSFKSIVSFDGNAALPHHMPDRTKLRKNSIVLMDIGARYNNYCSDITRTFMFRSDRRSGKYLKFTDMHNTVKKAQTTALRFIKEGELASKAHNAAAEQINSANNGRYKGTFIHSLGHAIGIEVHDSGPGLWPGSKEKLRANMVVSDEPGIYIVGFGGVRIEDDVIVTKSGAKVI